MDKGLLLEPEKIYQQSFAMIRQELGVQPFSDEQLPVVIRVIHATADFELGKSLLFHPAAVSAGIQAICRGMPIVTDVKMVQAGISMSRLQAFGNSLHCWIQDRDVQQEAAAKKRTRAMVAMRKAAKVADGGIMVVGNAPTALMELVHMVREEQFRPALVIGVPVGFVSVEESKAMLQQIQEVPYITNVGRKGGSPVASAILNALAVMAQSLACGSRTP